ncbi:MAG: hypothetical protein K9J16_02015 [Melioribacteraceae bacterium]|nr:hypothetical protein [Melioribacteraceae bacterium]MCF8353042.1 hypothetical protein [Melioribacteraceae bacterium]MCF8392933.1 hypothetical protein [Melioribacteraceae bacterium]MCF8417772.1 hypothetical protein [Melioribacteraceae bacterium]
MILKATRHASSYENFEVYCPYCNYHNIFNRATDIKNFKLILNKEVKCQNERCQKIFQIGGDDISHAWKMLIIDCFKLKRQKLYTNCILNLCQSVEMYFALFLRVNLLYKPFYKEDSYNLKYLNELKNLLYNKVKEWTYYPLYKTFLNCICQQIKPQTLIESESIINNLSINSKTEPSDSIINNIKDEKLSKTLIQLKRTNISSLRNKVVHKEGYRPTLDEVEKSEREISEILYSLDSCFRVLTDNFYFYETNL